MTIREAINLLEEVRVLDDSIYAYNKAYNEALEMALTALEAEEDWYESHEYPYKEQWIPVSSGLLPKAECGEGEDVLCQLENMRRIVLYFDGGNWCYPSGEPYIGVNYENGWSNKVVAWCPLPEPFREGGEEK